MFLLQIYRAHWNHALNRYESSYRSLSAKRVCPPYIGDKYTMDFQVAWVGTGLLLLWRPYKTELLFDIILIQYM
jgi:hypothetical protein